MKKHFAGLVHEATVVVLGDFILDEYLWGETSRISPEAPVPIVRMVGSELRLGGAANVVNNVHTLGAHVIPVSVIGDTQGWKLIAKLEEMGIQTNQIVQAEEYKNSHKIRIVSGAQQMLRLDNDKETTISESTELALIENLKYSIKRATALVISDYKKGVCTPRVCAKAIHYANELNIPIIIDPKGTDYSIYKGSTLITPNEVELEAITGIKIKEADEDTIQLAAMTFIKKLNLKCLVLTRSENGMTLYLKNGVFENLSSEALEVYDVTGAGDTVVAAIAVALSIGMYYDKACSLASEAAAIVVGKVGTATCTLSELMNEFPKIKELSDLTEELKVERSRGKTVVFTNGCFDLLHSGHVKLLQKASTYGDILVVGINSDESVRKLKGPDRPMIESSERAQLLAALNCVDYVTIFNDEDPLDIINMLCPDILAKGMDYKDKFIVGQSEVENAGGNVVLINLIDGKSTTNIIKKIQDSS